LQIDDGEAIAVLGFWLGEVSRDKRFARDPVLDAIIWERFGRLRERVLASGAEGWRDMPERA
jgi:uncharacterized protein (DUF924 family)